MALTDPPPPADLIKSARRVNRAMFFVGALFFLSGVRFFLSPGALARSSVGRALDGPWDDLWSVAFVVAGVLIMIGVGGRQPRAELPGITLASTAVLIQGAALLVLNGTAVIPLLPLYGLALWVFDGRRRDLLELPRERRRGRPDKRPLVGRLERRLLVAPVALLIAVAAPAPPSGPDAWVMLMVAVLGGGIVTAVGQVFLIRPQRRTLEGGLSKMAVETARGMLEEARTELAETRQELERAEHRIEVLEGEKRDLVKRVGVLEDQARRDHETIAELAQRARGK